MACVMDIKFTKWTNRNCASVSLSMIAPPVKKTSTELAKRKFLKLSVAMSGFFGAKRGHNADNEH